MNGAASLPAVLACSDCGAALKPCPRRKGTRCKPCTARATATDPAVKAKMSAGTTRRWAQPGERAKHSALLKARFAAHPEWIERARRLGNEHNNLARFAKPFPAGHPSRISAGRKRTERLLGWCPPGYREAYRHMTNIDGLRAPEARRIIEGQIAADVKALNAGTLPVAQFLTVRAAARWIRERNGNA